MALDHIAAVAWIPGEHVVAVAHKRCVAAGAARDEVVALAAADDIDAGAAVEAQDHLAGQHAAGVDRVVTGAAEDRQHIAGLGMGDRHLLGQAADRDSAA